MHFAQSPEMRRRRLLLRTLATLAACALLGLVPAACGGVVVIDYDRSCRVATDCVWIHEGEPQCCTSDTDPCSANGAINRQDLHRYRVDFDAAKSANCHEELACLENATCRADVACVANRCELVKLQML
jgi:hypothetical protein